MSQKEYCSATPQEHIMDLYAKTKDGKMPISYFEYDCDPPYERVYAVKWTREDAEALVQKYDVLTTALKKIAQLHEQLQTEDDCKKMLTKEENIVWETYIRPYEVFDVDNIKLSELYDRSRDGDDLTEEEVDILERHYEWSCEQSLKRLPFVGDYPMHVITRARRYERLLSLDAPEIIVNGEACGLAEEMILYYFLNEKSE